LTMKKTIIIKIKNKSLYDAMGPFLLKNMYKNYKEDLESGELVIDQDDENMEIRLLVTGTEEELKRVLKEGIRQKMFKRMAGPAISFSVVDGHQN
jgi:hypothetical protein